MPLGYVSDEANKFFSPIELSALRESIVGGIRTFWGPGKRGEKVGCTQQGLIICRDNYSPHVQLLKIKVEDNSILQEYRFKIGFMYDNFLIQNTLVFFSF